jgi:hypothetical protein
MFLIILRRQLFVDGDSEFLLTANYGGVKFGVQTTELCLTESSVAFIKRKCIGGQLM